MPMLSFADPLPRRPHRVLVAGTSGSGKTTLAARVAQVLEVPHVEMDALYHGPGWTPRESFMAEVDAFTSAAEWVTEWQYGAARPLLADRADLMVWLDLPRAVVMRQVGLRTLRRRLRREVLWNGNVEPPLHTILRDEEHVVRWAWATHHKAAERIGELLRERPDFPVVRLRSRREADRWVSGLTRSR